MFGKSLSNEGSTVKEVPCMGLVKRAIETNQKTQVVSWIALGVAVFALAIVMVGVSRAN